MSFSAEELRQVGRDLVADTIGVQFATLTRKVPNVDPAGGGPAPPAEDAITVPCLFGAVKTTDRGEHRAVTLFGDLGGERPDANFSLIESDAAGSPLAGRIWHRLVDAQGPAASLPTSTGAAFVTVHMQEGAP